MLLLLIVFPYETPVVLKENENYEDLNELMMRIYQDEVEAEARINEIYVAPKQIEGEVDETENDRNPSCGAVCCDPRYSRATFVGCMLAVL